ncbi:MAG: UDP-glucose--hexose-1-phosphate uridylyltransferase [Lachnospiraceae bacterium]|jgi:UDPglucose--hexose-1-phosphate uridylyltransferase
MTETEEGIRRLVSYGLGTGLIEKDDAMYTANRLLDVCKCEPSPAFTAFDIRPAEDTSDLEEILKGLLDDAVTRGVCQEGTASRDLFDTRLMSCLTPRPSLVTENFREKYKESPEAATDYFYRLSRDSDYIRTYRVKKDLKWQTATKYGDLDITINLSKPEKDPKAIAAALKRKSASYPKCLLCPENEGYAGRLDHPARQTIRLIPLTLGGEEWFMQYSPYVYYNEHCIVLSRNHTPMKIDRMTFVRLFEFVTKFPHYTIGSNADLPIVGGSILTHEHFQGGRYTFAMAKAGLREQLTFEGFEDVSAGIVNWPMSVIRLDGKDPERITALADKILLSWRGYSDEAAEILAYTVEDGQKTPHNTITPIARRRGEEYELDLVLRNNRTTEEYPLGIFHPHQELHHIKKENIGLIEVMGLAVLPARLKGEMSLVMDTILSGGRVADNPKIASHGKWVDDIIGRHPEFAPDNAPFADGAREKLREILREEIGIVFSKVLEDAGVYKDTAEGRESFKKFIKFVNNVQ